MKKQSDELRIEYIDLEKLKKHPRNPKEHDLGAIGQSIDRFGFRMPIAIDEKSGLLAAGHGRVDELTRRKEDGREAPVGIKTVKVSSGPKNKMKESWLIPVIRGMYFDSKRELEGYLVADNRPVVLGGWKDDELVRLLQDQLKGEHGLTGTGFDQDDLDAIARALADPPAPTSFPAVDENIKTEYACPMCHYEWSGKPKPETAEEGTNGSK